MDGYIPATSSSSSKMTMMMKRKEMEDVNEDFSDFSLSSPARKIRRLDAELAPIIEEEEDEGCFGVGMEDELPQQQQQQQMVFGNNGGLRIEELAAAAENEERAIVLFKPVDNNNINAPSILQSPSNFTVSVDPDLISGFKNQVLWSNGSNSLRLVDNDEVAKDDGSSCPSNRCLAVVPWVPSQHPSAPDTEIEAQTDTYEMMDAEEVEGATMDIEDGFGSQQRSLTEAGGMSLSEGLQQWQQQHCMIPQPPQNSATPIFWHR